MKYLHPEKVILSDTSLYGYLKNNAENDPNGLFMFTETEKYSWRYCLKAVQSLASKFGLLDIKKGDTVALRAERKIDAVLLLLSLSLVGASAILCDTHFGVKEFISKMKLSPCFYLSCELGEWELFDKQFIHRAWIDIFDSTNFKNGDIVIKRQESNIDVHAPFVIVLTSGSTGGSKAVITDQYRYVNNSLEGRPIHGHKKGDISCVVLPLYHVFGISAIADSLVNHHPMFFPVNTETQYVLSCIEKYKISRMFSVPTFLLSMISCGLHKKYDLSSFRFVLMAGGPSTPGQFYEIEDALGVRLVSLYGMSEFTGITSMFYEMPQSVRATGVGVVYPHTKVKFVDENGIKIPQGKTGEICIKGYPLMLGYLDNEEETKAVIDSEGFFCTGDLGYIDEKNILHISGRKKDIIIRGGENISARKIEEAILELPYIRFVAVSGISDPVFGEVPAAMVALAAKENVTSDIISGDLIRSNKLVNPELPVKIMIVENIPMLSSGKVDKLKVKQLLG